VVLEDKYFSFGNNNTPEGDGYYTTIKLIEDFFTALSLAVIEAGKIFKKLLLKTTYFSLI
jgi:hypothetical protein